MSAWLWKYLDLKKKCWFEMMLGSMMNLGIRNDLKLT
jgi:hypothetical protein